MAEFRKEDLSNLGGNFKVKLSHSLRSPIACIKEAVALTLDGLCGPLNEKQTKTLKIAMKHIERLVKTIEEILEQGKSS